MKLLTEYRDAALVQRYVEAIHGLAPSPIRIMEVCGGQTHALVRFGIEALLPSTVTLLHGPGCPVCVTPMEALDQALALASDPTIVVCSYGDMLRVPGSKGDLASAKATGADVRIVYSPMDALALSERLPNREVVFFAVGFETTAPAHAMAVLEAHRRGIQNFSLLVAHVRVPPALEALLTTPPRTIDAFLAPGHVCTVMGTAEYEDLVARYQVPIVVTGFEPVDLLQGIFQVLRQWEDRRAALEIQYARSVRPEGNRNAQKAMTDVFHIVPQRWRGLGTLPQSGLALREAYGSFDAVRKFHLPLVPVDEGSVCPSGLVLRGQLHPQDCPSFDRSCTPEHPLGAPMVSSEGACAAYYLHGRRPSTE